MKNVVIRAPLLTSSGYGVHSRQVFKWLSKNKEFRVRTECVGWGNTAWLVAPELENGTIKKVMDASFPQGKTKDDISFQVQLPDEWEDTLAKFNVGITAAVETDRCNKEWLPHIDKMDLVIVPSNHIKKTILNTGNITTPIIVVPESYHESIDDNNNNKLDITFNTSFNFLILGQFTAGNAVDDRKNILNTIKWICETFKDDPTVGIILKTNHGRNSKIDREITRKHVQNAVNAVRVSEFPKIHVMHGYMTEQEVSSLYKHDSVKCLVTLTRGEGYGLPILEAAASDIPIIATNWSGHLDFLSHGKFIPVTYKLSLISSTRTDGRIFIEGTRWAEPLENNFKKKIKKFRHNYELPVAWAKDLGKCVREKYSHENICKIYDSVLSDHWNT